MQPLPDLPFILMVEDNEDDYEATIRGFKKVCLENPVYWCNCGKDALSFLRHEAPYSDAPTQLPALILLDLNMPGIDGRRFLDIIKHDEALNTVPVVVLTTSIDKSDVNCCYRLGVSTYIQKPVSFEGLVDTTQCIKEYWFGIAVLPHPDGNGTGSVSLH